jgi:UDP-glucuronate 4-epimerase
MKVLVTGGAGFIGSHLSDRLLQEGHQLVVVDNYDAFYPRSLKESNVKSHFKSLSYQFIEEDILNPASIRKQIKGNTPELIIHLAAKAGVRPSIDNPLAYEHANVQGTLCMLEMAKELKVKKIILASSSSVYGSNPNVPWREDDLALQPISPYASSKIAAEAFGRTYSGLYGMNVIALRFFTVFGPRQRPDLAINKFFTALRSNQPITVYGDGSTMRDYTFVDDIIEGIWGAIQRETRSGEFRIYNLGNSGTVRLSELINGIEEVAGKKLIINRQPEQPGDVFQTYADISRAASELGFKPSTSLKTGLQKFNSWQQGLLNV